MVDFKELPKDGRAFEQLVREICLVLDLHPQWSGQGPDQGRDLIITEKLDGQFGVLNQTWLVQCKHFAHSGKAVGREDVGNFIDDCRQIGANGYLLVTSTHPSAGLITKLKELSQRLENNLRIEVWDGVDIEKLLCEPKLFSLGHVFLPRSFAASPWKLYNGGSPNHWTAHYKTYFLHLSSRISGRHPDLQECEYIIARLEKLPNGHNEMIRPRAIFYDDKHCAFTVFADYLVPHSQKPAYRPSDFNKILHGAHGLHGDHTGWWDAACWDIAMRKVFISSDHFDRDHYGYYDPYTNDFKWGGTRGRSIAELDKQFNQWPEEDDSRILCPWP